MIIFGRRIKAREIPAKIAQQAMMLGRSLHFRHPGHYWQSYFKRQSPRGNVCKLRSGTSVYLSSNPHDIITVMVNFCRNEYGVIQAGWTVVDVGANIGVFTVMAMESGAGKVISFEPNEEAFQTLLRNVEENGFSEAVETYHRAVSSSSGQTLHIPICSSPYNKTKSEPTSDETKAVSTISLVDALRDHDRVDLMKLDCEGAEYQIILETDPAVFDKIKRIRMELHPSRQFTREQIVEHLEAFGFTLVKRVGLIFWFERL